MSHKGHYYRTEQFKLYDIPAEPIPIYLAASGPKSAHLAGRPGDGWIAQETDFLNPTLREAFTAGAHSAGKRPDAMPILVEHFAVVGDHEATEYSAAQWRFAGSTAATLLYEPNPVTIQRNAERTVWRYQTYTPNGQVATIPTPTSWPCSASSISVESRL